MDLTKVLDDCFWKVVQQFEQEKYMPYEKQHVTLEKRRAAKWGLLKGIELALDLKFGSEGQRLMPEIGQIDDVEILEAILRSIKTATTLDDVRRAGEKESPLNT